MKNSFWLKFWLEYSSLSLVCRALVHKHVDKMNPNGLKDLSRIEMKIISW